jgi:two-component system, NtrC family, response regulator AtoC
MDGALFSSTQEHGARGILVIDDEDAAVFGYTQYLKRHGYTVTSAGCLKDGRAKLLDNEYRAVVLDMRLPDGDAIHLIPEIRAKNKDVKIVMVSGLSDEKVVQAALQMGADAYLPKPLQMRELCDSLAQLLQD